MCIRDSLRVQDPGKVEGNPVFIYLDAFCRPEHFAEFWPEYQNLDELKAHYQRGGLGDVKVKKFLNSVMQAELEPISTRRKEWEQRLPEVVEILKDVYKRQVQLQEGLAEACREGGGGLGDAALGACQLCSEAGQEVVPVSYTHLRRTNGRSNRFSSGKKTQRGCL